MQSSLFDALVQYMKEEPFAFMEENVMESTKPRRQFVAGAKRIAMYGLIFGTVAGSMFAIVNTLFSNWFGNHGEPEEIALNTTIIPLETNAPKETKAPPKSETGANKNELEHIQNIYSQIAKQAKITNRALVQILAIPEEGKDADALDTDSFSGIVVAKTKKNAMILTRYSSVKNMQEMKVILMDQSTVTGSLYNYDSRTNLAIIKVALSDMTKTALTNLMVIDFGESRYLSQGDFVYVTGQPDGMVNSVEFGYITREASALNMEDYQMELYGTGMAYHSNGYGIVCDVDGKCLGILDSKYSQEGTTTFAGMDKLEPILENLLNQKEQVYVGVYGRGITEEYLAQFNYETGLYVTDVTVDSPAYKAGIQAGDVIRKISGEQVKDAVQFFELLQNYKPRETVEFTIARDSSEGKKEIELSVKLQERK